MSPVSRRWRQAALLAFASQLRWRAPACCLPLPLPVPAVPARTLRNPIRRSGFTLAYLHGGDLVVQLVDAQTATVRTVGFADGASLEPYEAPRRAFADHGPFNAGVGGVVGYRRHAAAAEGMAFYPAVACSGTAPSGSAWVAEGEWQNVLQAGNIVFLLRAHSSWWGEHELKADLLDTDSGGRATVDVTPLRDALREELEAASDRPSHGAVSAVEGHFIFHLSTQSGAKAAAALRLPARIAAQELRADPAVDAAVVFARRWCPMHALARLQGVLTNEKPCGESLMLWGDGAVGSRGCFQADVALLHARHGAAEVRQLVGPSTAGPHGSVAAAFGYGGIAAIDYTAVGDVVAACSLPRAGLPPPAVLVWDWRSAVCLHAVLLHPLPPDPPRQAASRTGPLPLRFAVGTHVECRMGEELWLPGVVAALHHGQPPRPYLIHLDQGDACHALHDHHEMIRAVANVGEVSWNSRTQAMEIAATACLALHPSSSRLAIGMWHDCAAAGVLYSISLGP